MNDRPDSSAGRAPEQAALEIIQLYTEILALKKLPRRGWLLRGIPPEECESVADHVFGTALLALLTARQFRPDLDRLRLLELAIVHELGEVEAGDLTPADSVPPPTKSQLERAGVKRLAGRLASGSWINDLWEEYEAGLSPEARFVRQLDKLEMAVQSKAYQRTQGIDPKEFIESAKERIKEAAVRLLLDQAVKDWPSPGSEAPD